MSILENVNHIDTVFLYKIFNLGGKRFFAVILPLISRSADGYYYPLIPFFILLIDQPAAFSFLFSAIIAFSIERPSYKIIKHCVKRNRPYEEQWGIKKVV